MAQTNNYPFYLPDDSHHPSPGHQAPSSSSFMFNGPSHQDGTSQDGPDLSLQPAGKEPLYMSYDFLTDYGLDTDATATATGANGPILPPTIDSNAPCSETPARTGMDFRRRKNWPDRILTEITGFMHVLSSVGKVLYCSESTFESTGYRPHELLGQAFTDFLHVDDLDVFIRDFNMAFHSKDPIRTYFRFRKSDGSFVIFEVLGQVKTGGSSVSTDAFFAMAQPIPSRNGSLVDAFLELKLENQWLKARINDSMQQYYGNANGNPLSETNTSDSLPGSYAHYSTADMSDGSALNSEEKPANSTTNAFMPDLNINDAPVQRFNSSKKYYICADCGITSSPEWRKGPQGPKT
ncbi:uncharacterized protein BYT42DRAFT_616133 [Radiomyces spectabilis]|uniref:uncharacterized protein n=1 Tax=Radiomyces spectabilis TaxID=64574 RepID=UPI00221FE7B2|nr:uncharacterized protein BYT42DRAFT_616133 [Radiomyces spectabilis]KAI8372938.1 hypothetical protein BYT42DRAFT_616133 [Radiomyces spectabilis]